MKIGRSVRLALALGVGAAMACGSGSDAPFAPQTGDVTWNDASANDASANDARTTDAPTDRDGGAPASDAVTPSDAKGCLPPNPNGGMSAADCPRPPDGFVACGSGALSGAAARAACDALNPGLDLGMVLKKHCDAFALDNGRYEAFCGADSVYMWISFEASLSDALACPISVVLPDGGTFSTTNYAFPWDPYFNADLYVHIDPYGGGLAMRKSYPWVTPDRPSGTTSWSGRISFDGEFTAREAKGTASTYLSLMRKACRNYDAEGSGLVIAAPKLAWSRP